MLPIVISFLISFSSQTALAAQLGMFFSVSVQLIWAYSICILILKKYSQTLNVPIARFKISMLIVLIYTAIVCFDILPPDYMFPLHLLCFACNIYYLYFLSKLIVMVEKQRTVNFPDYISTILWAYFLIFGIWVLQPRINRIFFPDDADS